MGSQHEITEPLELLDEKGHLVEPGYARKLLWRYSSLLTQQCNWHQ